VLEVDVALERVAARASSVLGREKVLALRPGTDRQRLSEELATVQEAADFLEERSNWVPPELPDARSALRRLAPDGSVLDPDQLFRVRALLTAGRALREALGESHETLPRLWAAVRELHTDVRRETEIGRTVDGSGQVLDSASKELRRIRGELRRAHTRIVRRLEQYLPSLDERHRVSDASVTIRNGRYVVPVRREGRRDVGGIVHDESATGATLFIEPPLAIQLMNDLKELEQEEAREVHRILTEHSRALRPSLRELEASQEAVARFDSLYARARTAREWGATPPELLESGSQELRVVRGRHPLLDTTAEGTVVPFDLQLGPGERAMVVSGPNTGGKTVFLKAIGLLSALAQCGVVPPVGPGTRLPIFDDIFADIGDEQSIARSLSTFSAHLSNLRHILEHAGSGSLVLIDEMGTGTDPAEGAALARAMLEALVERRALSIVTSHLGALKRLDTEGSGVVNASLEFDPDRMEPTYVLVKGRPGRSYGLAIARTLGFPPAVLDRAEEHLSEEDVRLDELLAKLERAEREARESAESLADEKADTLRRAEELEVRERDLAVRERSAERQAREEARRMLLNARSEVEQAIREVREAGSEELARVGRDARRRVERAAARHEPVGELEVEAGAIPLQAGTQVRIRASGTPAEVVEVRDDRAVISASGIRMTVPLTELVPAVAASAPAQRLADRGGWVAPEVSGSSELDLRGLRVDEVQLELERALDGAVLQDLGELRIIHGKGTGALRQRVQELLRSEGRVREFRLGGPGEGGAGVTVARLR
jgi:DNA mismatch repair protein MutS2